MVCVGASSDLQLWFFVFLPPFLHFPAKKLHVGLIFFFPLGFFIVFLAIISLALIFPKVL